jgi:hypothetical protein
MVRCLAAHTAAVQPSVGAVVVQHRDPSAFLSLRWVNVRLFSIFKMASRRNSLGGVQPGIEAEQSRAVGAHARRLDREVDVRMIMRRQHADTVEFVDADANLGRRKFVVKFEHH